MKRGVEKHICRYNDSMHKKYTKTLIKQNRLAQKRKYVIKYISMKNLTFIFRLFFVPFNLTEMFYFVFLLKPRTWRCHIKCLFHQHPFN